MTVVAIDGPAGAGKTTVARAVAARLGWTYLDTGAMYRAVALAALERGVDLDDTTALAALARSLDLHVDDAVVRLEGRDVTAEIREERIGAAASRVSVHEDVRRALVALQQDAARTGRIVMEGRDIGTVVAPDASVKVFLVADARERARRRAKQVGVHDDAEALAQIESSVAARDASDAQRAASPLKKADEAVLVDTTGKTVDAVVDEIVSLVQAVG